MANLDAPLGFRPVENGVAGVTSKLRKYTVAASTAVYEGDLVSLNSSGLVVVANDADAVAGDIIGVAAHHVPSGGAGPASDLSILVYDDPEQLFEAQCDDNSVTALVDYQGRLFDWVLTTGNTTTLQSKHEIEGASSTSVVGTNAATVMPLRCVGISPQINNEIGTVDGSLVSFTRLQVKIHPFVHLHGSGGISTGGNDTGSGLT